MGDKRKDISGQRFGKLVVIGYHSSFKTGTKWLCKCDCGNEKVVKKIGLTQGTTQSCGCYRHDVIFKHGLSATPEYVAWMHIKHRCYNPKDRQYKYYGARGIVMCDRWKDSFLNFLEDMGKKPNPKLTIDRIDNDGNYEPSNCKWDTQKEQTRNRRGNRILTYKSQTKVLAEWAEVLGVKSQTISTQLRRNNNDFTTVIEKYNHHVPK